MHGGRSKSLVFSADVMAGCQPQVASNINITKAIYRVQCTVNRRLVALLEFSGQVMLWFTFKISEDEKSFENKTLASDSDYYFSV